MGTNGSEAGAFEEIARKYARIAAGYDERLPRLEQELDESKSLSHACLGVAKEARDAAKEAARAARSCEAAVKELMGAARDVAKEVARETAEDVATDVAEHSSRYEIRKLDATMTGPHEKVAEVEKRLAEMDGLKKGSDEAMTNLRNWVLFGIAVAVAIAGFSAWVAAHSGH